MNDPVNIFANVFVIVLLFGGMIAVYLIALRNAKKRIAALERFAKRNKLTFEPIPDTGFEIKGSYKKGNISNIISGSLPKSKNYFLFCEQQETRGSGKNSTTYHRTIVRVDIPESKIQLIVNSQINRDEASGGNLARYRNSQKYEAEGDFSKYFDIYIPKGGETEALTFLAPDVLVFILDNFADYDVEIVGKYLFLYSYKDDLDIRTYQSLLNNVDGLVHELEIRPKDARGVHKVAKATAGQDNTMSLLRKPRITALALFVVFLLVQVFGTFILPQSVTNSKLYLYSGYVFGAGILAFMGWKYINEYRLKNEYLKDVKKNKKL